MAKCSQERTMIQIAGEKIYVIFHKFKEDFFSCETVDLSEYNRFQYILAAPTSIATKYGDPSLTYINQGQVTSITSLQQFSDHLFSLTRSRSRSLGTSLVTTGRSGFVPQSGFASMSVDFSILRVNRSPSGPGDNHLFCCFLQNREIIVNR